MKVIFETALINVLDEDDNNVDVFERIDIVKENGEKLSENDKFDKSALVVDKFTGLCWGASQVKELLNFLGIEFEEKKSSKKEKF